MEGVVNQKIIAVRKMTKGEMEREGWDFPAMVLVLDNGIKLYPSMDDEGNGSGALFGVDNKGRTFYVL